MECLEAYDWPGNVRQLENVIERAVALEATDEILPESLPAEVRPGTGPGGRVRDPAARERGSTSRITWRAAAALHAGGHAAQRRVSRPGLRSS